LENPLSIDEVIDRVSCSTFWNTVYCHCQAALQYKCRAHNAIDVDHCWLLSHLSNRWFMAMCLDGSICHLARKWVWAKV